MNAQDHYRALERMYAVAPINQRHRPELTIEEGRATVSMDVDRELFHTGGAVHGSIYFKLMDDAAFFAVNSLETTYFVLTTSLTTYLTRPVGEGRMTARGRVLNQNRSQWIAEAVVYDSAEREIGRASGVFMRSRYRLAETPGYADSIEAP